MKVGIVGRSKDTLRYEQFLDSMKVSHITSLSISNLSSCQAFLFPGGGDMNPKLFGENNQGSINIDTELDLLQLRAFQYAFSQKKPILGFVTSITSAAKISTTQTANSTPSRAIVLSLR